MRTVPPLTRSGTYCVTTSVPSAKRYQRRTALVAPADWSTTGVVQPLAPPRVRVMFGRYSRDVAGRTAAMPMPVGALSVMPSTAKVPPVTTSPCWPVATHVDAPAVGHEVVPLAWKRGSNDHERPARTVAGAVTVACAPLELRKVSVGLASVEPTFCTITRVVRLPSLFRTT